MKKIVDWLLFTSTYTAFCALGLCMATERLINHAAPALINALHCLIFGSTLLVYNLHHALKKISNKTSIVNRHSQLPHLCFSCLGIVMTAGSLFFLPLRLILVGVVTGFISLAYSLPLLPFANVKRIREIGWLKIIALALVWALVTSIMPIIYWHKSPFDYPFELSLRLALIFALCILFDVRDIQTDKARNIKTLPQRLGLRRSYILMYCSAIVFIGLSFFQFIRFHDFSSVYSAVITAFALWGVAIYLKNHPTEKAYILLGDGIMLLYSAIVLLA